MNNKNTNPYSNLDLRQQIYMECKSMAKYALSNGGNIPGDTIRNIESFEIYNPGTDESAPPQLKRDLDISELVNAHNTLARLIEPATPKTVLLLDMEQKTETLLKFLGPVSLVRQLMLAAVLSLIIFVVIMCSPYIDDDKLAQDVLTADGIDQMTRLIFYISAAGLGASFTALYTANTYISKGTYDPCYQSSYWIRFLLGIIAGLLLSLLISEQSMSGSDLISKGIVRPLLAILGGFSADLLYSFLNRMVETFKSLFENDSKGMIEAKNMETRAKLAELEIERRMKLSQDLMQLHQQIGAESDPEQVKQQVQGILEGLMQTKTPA